MAKAATKTATPDKEIPEALKPRAPTTAKEGNKPSSSGEKITLAYKGPMGLILRVFDFEEYQTPVLGGGTRTERRAIQRDTTVRIDGYSIPDGVRDHGKDLAGEGFGYALTTGVDKDFWDLWCKQNKDHPVLKQRLLFAAKDEQAARDMVKENDQDKIKSGLEPLDRANLPKMGALTVETFKKETA